MKASRDKNFECRHEGLTEIELAKDRAKSAKSTKNARVQKNKNFNKSKQQRITSNTAFVCACNTTRKYLPNMQGQLNLLRGSSNKRGSKVSYQTPILVRFGTFFRQRL